jgi:hypothetical protein
MEKTEGFPSVFYKQIGGEVLENPGKPDFGNLAAKSFLLDIKGNLVKIVLSKITTA